MFDMPNHVEFKSSTLRPELTYGGFLANANEEDFFTMSNQPFARIAEIGQDLRFQGKFPKTVAMPFCDDIPFRSEGRCDVSAITGSFPHMDNRLPGLQWLVAFLICALRGHTTRLFSRTQNY
jgi:hypothetical protein